MLPDEHTLITVAMFTPILLVLAFKGESILAMIGLLILTLITLFTNKQKSILPYSYIYNKNYPYTHYLKDNFNFQPNKNIHSQHDYLEINSKPKMCNNDCFESWNGGVLRGIGSQHSNFRDLTNQFMKSRREDGICRNWRGV